MGKNALIRGKSTVLKPEILSIKINQQKIEWYSLLNHANKISYLDSLTISQQQLFTYGKVFNQQKTDSFKNSYKGISFSDISKFNPLPKDLTLPYNQNNITIEYNAPELSENFILNYQYILEGYDKGWSPIIKKTEATFGNINAGEYTFKVKAQYPNGTWSEPANFNFKVLPPFYKTFWAYLCYAISGLFVLRLIIKWRVASFKKRQKELEVQRKALENQKIKEEEQARREELAKIQALQKTIG